MAPSEDRSVPEGAGSGAESKEAAGTESESIDAKRARWFDENREAFASTNREFERRGLLLADLLAEADSTESSGADDEVWINASRAGRELL